ncbi:MAG: M48 family metalloprotease [Gammaproteobacteria bacterium]|nr:M48 family metalloprotease [Gammaproteobacteria bacterium]
MPRFSLATGPRGVERIAAATVHSSDKVNFMRTDERQSNSYRTPRAPGRVRRNCKAIRACLMLLMTIGGAMGFAGSPDAQVRLPELGDAAEATLSPAGERALGEAFMREVRARLTLVDDPMVEQYVQSLGYRLAASSDRRDLAFTFFVVEDDSLNAFAAPGGFIGLNSGMVLATQSESEFASVLAHEIAHVTQRHIVRAIDHASRSNLPVLAGILAAIIVGAHDVEAGQAAAAAVIGTTAQSQINFTRQNEMEADRVGIRILADAGFDPRAMAGVFETLQDAARYSPRPPEYLSTHPVTTNRIAEARDRAERLPYRQHESSERYYLVRAKLRVRTADDAQRVLDRLVEEHASGHAQSAAANSYGQAIAMIRLGREDDARGILEHLVETFPDNLTFLDELAGNMLRSGNLPRALDLYSEGLALYPNDRILVRGHAAALNEAGRMADTLKLIDEYGRLNAIDSEMYRLRADAYQRLGRMSESRADLAEYYYLSGRLDQAIDQLRLASQDLAQNQDFYAIARIEARLEELETERRVRLTRR